MTKSARRIFRPILRIAFMWLGIGSLVGTGIVCLPGQQAKPEQSLDARVFFPLAVGNTWRFVNTVGGESTTQVVRLEKVNNEEGYRLETSMGNRVTSWEVLAQRPDGLYRLAANDVRLEPPALVVKNPIKLGESWSFQSAVKDRVIKGTLAVQSLAEEVATRAGTFKCLKIGGDNLELGKQKLALTTWFAPNVGPVKISVKIGDQETTLELVEYKLASPASSKTPGNTKPDKPKPEK